MSPISTSGVSFEVNSVAPPISIAAQKMDKIREVLISLLMVRFPFNQSVIVEDASAFMDELSVDMAAENIPATMNPASPAGR